MMPFSIVRHYQILNFSSSLGDFRSDNFEIGSKVRKYSEKVSRRSRNCRLSEKQTIEPGGKSNVTEIPGEKIAKNLRVLRVVLFFSGDSPISCFIRRGKFRKI